MPTQTQPQIQPQSQPQTQGLDPTVVALAQSIRQVESNGDFNAKGASGEIGAYQFEPNTWNAVAPKYGVTTPLEQATPQEQNAVAYNRILDLKNQGYNPAQIASIWNSGSPNWQGNVGTNAQGFAYNTPDYVTKVYDTYQDIQNGNQTNQTSTIAGTNQGLPQQQPPSYSVGGFLGNILKSGAGLLGNIGQAALHPVQTLQNIGSVPVGALQEAAGEQTQNTQNFDAVKNYFSQRYGIGDFSQGNISGGLDQIMQSIYNDPVGVASDISGLALGGAGALGAGSKLAELGGLGEVGQAATETSAAIEGSGLAGAAKTGASALNTISNVTNPVALPLIAAEKVAGASLVDKAVETIGSQATRLPPETIADIFQNPQDYSPETFATVSSDSMAEEIKSALDQKDAELSDVGSGYNAYRINPTPIQVAPDFLDEAFRKGAGVTVEDGVISANASSVVRSSADINKLQSIYNLYKGDFLNGTMDSNKFLNLRSDLAEKANFGNGLTKNLERAAAGIRSDLNTEYRSQIGGLEQQDALNSNLTKENEQLRDGIINKRTGELNKTFVNKLGKATKEGNSQFINQLEGIIPGITRRLEILKNVEAVRKASEAVGSGPSSYLKAGGVLYALSTGNLKNIGGALALVALSEPEKAANIIRALGSNKALISVTLSNMVKAMNLYGLANRSLSASNSMSQIPNNIESGTSQTTIPSEENSQIPNIQPSSPQGSSSSNPTTSNFDYQAAVNAGYTPQEIQQFLAEQGIQTQ